MLEITESTLIDDSDWPPGNSASCAPCGIRTALDDFGTGYSSLGLRAAPAARHHQDRQGVRAVGRRASAVTRWPTPSSTWRATSGLRTVAEGVETESQAVELARLGCEFAQGYLFFKPLSAVAMTALSEFEHQPTSPATRSRGRASLAIGRSRAPTIAASDTNASRSMPPPTGQRPWPTQHPAPATDRASSLWSRLALETSRPSTLTHLLRPLLS